MEVWRTVVAIGAGYLHSIGLVVDGTVLAADWNAFGQCKVGSWRDIVAMSSGCIYTIGLRLNDTVVAVGNGEYDQRGVGGW